MDKIARKPCPRCNQGPFATLEAHNMHAVYRNNRPVRCLNVDDLPLYMVDGELSHVPASQKRLDPDPMPTPQRNNKSPQKLPQAVSERVRTTRGDELTCRDCGKLYKRSGKVGRPPVRCEECR